MAMIVKEKNEGAKIPYTVKGSKITFDDELMVNVQLLFLLTDCPKGQCAFVHIKGNRVTLDGLPLHPAAAGAILAFR